LNICSLGKPPPGDFFNVAEGRRVGICHSTAVLVLQDQNYEEAQQQKEPQGRQKSCRMASWWIYPEQQLVSQHRTI